MKKTAKVIAILAVLFITLSALPGCLGGPKDEARAQKQLDIADEDWKKDLAGIREIQKAEEAIKNTPYISEQFLLDNINRKKSLVTSIKSTQAVYRSMEKLDITGSQGTHARGMELAITAYLQWLNDNIMLLQKSGCSIAENPAEPEATARETFVKYWDKLQKEFEAAEKELKKVE